MLKDSPMWSSFAVTDIEAARAFYGGTLGLDVRDSPDTGLLEIHDRSGTRVLVYPKPDHEPAGFTVLNFPVPDVDAAVDALIAAGVRMEQYDNEYIKTDAKGIARDDRGPQIAWFRDPSGNILAVLQTPPTRRPL
jgi:catechol 2,3-dioxygenase-like lactoylglutathione lyase family enzyme